MKRRRGLGDQPKEIGLREGNIFKMSSAKQRKQAKEKKAVHKTKNEGFQSKYLSMNKIQLDNTQLFHFSLFSIKIL